MNEKSRYHQQIEENFETADTDVGRVKNIGLAQELSLPMDAARSHHQEMIEDGWSVEPKTKEQWNETDDRFIKSKLAERAVRGASEGLLHNIAVAGLNGEATPIDVSHSIAHLQNEAATVGRDYDSLQDKARYSAEARENGAEFLDLSSDEFTIALAEAPVYRKAAIVKARRAMPGEVVATVTPDGVEEGRNTAGEDDHVVTGVNGADFILPGEKFNKLYEETEESGVFQSRGMARIIDNPTGKKIGILAPWGEMQYGDSESKIAVQYDPQNPEVIGADRYILDKTEFAAYKMEVESAA